MRKAVVVVSGGMDSVTLLHFAVKKMNFEVFPIHFRYGQRHSYEGEMAEWNVKKLQEEGYNVHDLVVVDMSFFKNLVSKSSALLEGKELPTYEEVVDDPQPVTYVPFRNMVLLSIALAFAEGVGAEYVLYGAQRQDYAGYWDTTPEFVEAINNVTKLNRKSKIKVVAPFVSLRKSEIVAIGRALGVDYSKTWSCYRGPNENGKACGKCPTCVDRIKAFAENGVVDPIKYEISVDWDELFKKYKREFNVEELMKKVVEVFK